MTGIDDDLINRLMGEYSVGVNKEFGAIKAFVLPISIEAANKIKELQERLDCIKKILDEAYYVEPMQSGILDQHVDGYRKKGVARAHRVALVEELPKRVKE